MIALSSAVAPVSARPSVAVRAQATDAPARKLSPLERGGTLKGEKAAGKDAAAATLSQMKGGENGTFMAVVDGKFTDDR